MALNLDNGCGAAIGTKSQRKPVIPMVQQGLVNGDPDMDAIFHLTRKQNGVAFDIRFADRQPVAIPHHVYTPFNSKNTLFTYDALWGLLLPVTLTSRASDIWRSYFMQRLLFDSPGSLIFTGPNVLQVRR